MRVFQEIVCQIPLFKKMISEFGFSIESDIELIYNLYKGLDKDPWGFVLTKSLRNKFKIARDLNDFDVKRRFDDFIGSHQVKGELHKFEIDNYEIITEEGTTGHGALLNDYRHGLIKIVKVK